MYRNIKENGLSNICLENIEERYVIIGKLNFAYNARQNVHIYKSKLNGAEWCSMVLAQE